ncbi:MAG: hypothetical protein ACOVP4_11045 [Bacteriovoracaceae bacterium]
MKREISMEFQEKLVTQYRDLIHEAVLESESEHRTVLNLGRLNAKLKVILKAAQYDGLPENVINTLIDEAVPTTQTYSRAA